jgi:hypothetical protein
LQDRWSCSLRASTTLAGEAGDENFACHVLFGWAMMLSTDSRDGKIRIRTAFSRTF